MFPEIMDFEKRSSHLLG